MSAAQSTPAASKAGLLRTSLLTVPALLVFGGAALAWQDATQDDSSKKAVVQDDSKVQEDAKAAYERKMQEAKKAAQEKAAEAKKKAADAQQGDDAQQDAKKNRLTGKDAPPPPLVIPRKGGNGPTPAPIQQKSTNQQKTTKGGDGVGLSGPQKPLSPEEQRKMELLKAQGLSGNLSQGGARGPRPPVNPKAKLEIEFGTETHDFGRIRQGDEATHTFNLKSSGEEAVVISQASPTCGCLVGEIKTKAPGEAEFTDYTLGDLIAPGSDITVDATIQTASKQNKTQVRINVYTNDPVGLTQLALHANVEPFLRATPSFLQLGDVPEGEERTGRIDVRTSRGEKVMMSVDNTRNIPLPEGFSYELVPVNPDADGKSNHWQVSMRVAPESTEGPKGYALSLITDIKMPETKKTADQRAKMQALGKELSPQMEYYSINTNVNYRILGVLSVSPQYLSMGLVRPGQPVVRNVKLIAQDPNFDLSGVKVSLEGEGGQPLQWAENFSTTVKPAVGMNAVDIQLNLAGLPEGADGSFRGIMKIETGHESKPEMLVRFSGVCRKLATGR